MKTNRLMRSLLESTRASIPIGPGSSSAPSLEVAAFDGSILLVQQFRQSVSVSPKDFPDRTGYECFVNHIHLRYNGTRDSLMGLLSVVTQLQQNLAQYARDRQFLIILSIAGTECVVRFHECRAGERWLVNDLEAYKEEAILALSVGTGAGGPDATRAE